MTDSDWLDGRRVVEWLEERVGRGELTDRGPLGASLAKRVRDWRNGFPANVYLVDDVLIRLGLTLAELPEGLEVEAPVMGPKLTARHAAKIRQEQTGPESYPALAERYGVRPQTIRRIVNGELW